MVLPNIASIVSTALQEELDSSPDPLRNRWWLDGPRLTYRQELDLQPVNRRGERIPRIVTVRRNLRKLGKPPKPPQLPD